MKIIFRVILSLAAIVHGVEHGVLASKGSELLAAEENVASPKRLRFDFSDLRATEDSIQAHKRGVFHFGPWSMEADMMTFSKSTKVLKLFGNVLVRGRGLHFKTVFVELNVKEKRGFTGSLEGLWHADRNTEFNMESEPVQHHHHDDEASSHRSIDFGARSYHLKAHHAVLSPSAEDHVEIVLRNVSLSDCDAHRPHYDFYIGKMRWSQDRRVEVQHVLPRLFRVPYFYWPYAGRDISRDWPWTRWQAGSEKDWGRFVSFETLLMPEKTAEDLRLKTVYRENRGSAIGFHWDRQKGLDSQKADLTLMKEKWKEEGVSLDENRWRLDIEQRKQLDEDWKMSLDVHAQNRRKTAVWSGNGRKTLSTNFFAAPAAIGGAVSTQDRESYVQEYDETHWENGRLDENEWLLEYQRQGRYFKLGSLYPSDGQDLLGRTKLAEMRYREFDIPMARASKLNMNVDLGLMWGGQRMGWDLDESDLRTLSGNLSQTRFETWRGDALLEVEKSVHVGAIKLRPWMGYRMLSYGEAWASPQEQLSFYDVYGAQAIDKDVWSHRWVGGLDLDTVFTGLWRQGRTLHQWRPSLKMNVNGPSSWSQERVVVEVDEIDLERRPSFELIWGMEQEWMARESSTQQRLLYTQSLFYRQLFSDEDEVLLFGRDRKAGADVRFHHALYPSRHWSLYSEVQMNSIHRQVPWIKSGFSVNKEGHEISYHYNYRKDLRVPSDVINRHDVEYAFFSRWDEFSLRLSWEGEKANSVLKDDDFYRRGFRSFEMIWAHIFHCLRTEVEFEYDFEDSGASLIFRFGPQLFKESLPRASQGVRGL